MFYNYICFFVNYLLNIPLVTRYSGNVAALMHESIFVVVPVQQNETHVMTRKFKHATPPMPVSFYFVEFVQNTASKVNYFTRDC